MKARDAVAVAALRSAVAAVDNAEAIAPGTEAAPLDGVIAKSVAGLGAAEALRRELSEDEVAGIVRAEVAERRAAAVEYQDAGHHDHATRLRAEADILAAHLAGA